MRTYLGKSWSPWLALAAILGLFPLAVMAGDRHAKAAKYGQYNPDDENVEMFDAMGKGEIAVKVIPKDSTQCRVMIENKTDKPLNVKLPETFGIAPILAQAAAAGGGARGGRGGGGAQAGGGGMGMGMGGMGMGGGGGGMFNVPPEAVGQLKANTVCLEHGKPEPRAAIPYEIKPLENVTDKPVVRDLCAMLGRGEVAQRAAQVAAWHLNNGMSWDQLAAKQLRFANGTSQPYFTPQELQAGMVAATRSVQLASERAKSTTSSASSSSTSSSSDSAAQK